MTYLLRLSACLFLCVSLNSFGAILGSSTINFNSTNHYWSATPLIITDGGNVTHHTIQLTSINSNYNNGNTEFLPSTLSFTQHLQGGSRVMNLCAQESYTNCISIVDTTYIKTLEIGPSGPWTAAGSTNNFIGRLMPSNGNHTINGAFYAHWTGGNGTNSFVSGTVEIIAFGTSPVPLPAGIYLFLSGLVGLGLMRGRNISVLR